MEQRNDEEPRIIGGFVRFHRLIDGIPIRGSSSYIELNLILFLMFLK
ncbi:MAG: hypothetical protein JXR53_01640 [Bacteroidales bacterium]|nr:hypothetical protein [Bacteroidales bacterium]